jgi:hypothetical protein
VWWKVVEGSRKRTDVKREKTRIDVTWIGDEKIGGGLELKRLEMERS